jgi:hypothetical protein
MDKSTGGGVLLLGKCNYFMEKLDLSSAAFDTLSSTNILGIKCSNNISTVFIFVIYRVIQIGIRGPISFLF